MDEVNDSLGPPVGDILDTPLLTTATINCEIKVGLKYFGVLHY